MKSNQIISYEGIRHNNGDSGKIRDFLVVEAALQININHEPYTVVMRTPGDDIELITGLLYAEDIYKGDEQLQMKIKEEHQNGFAIYDVKIPSEHLGKGYMNKRTLLSVSSCGICGKQQLEDISFEGTPLSNTHRFDVSKIPSLYELMKEAQGTFEQSGGSHAAAIFNTDYELLTLKEDIGRHNGVDKAVGHLLTEKSLKNAYCIFVSGRVSFEIISKAFIAKIPVVIAVSACSSLAVDYAKELGITLIGFSRENRATIYSY